MSQWIDMQGDELFPPQNADGLKIKNAQKLTQSCAKFACIDHIDYINCINCIECIESIESIEFIDCILECVILTLF